MEESEPTTPLSPARRLCLLAGAWLLLVLSQPGLLDEGGVGLLAVPGMALWALGVGPSGRRFGWVVWGTAALGLLGWFQWMRHLLVWLLPAMGAVPALWILLGAHCTRSLARTLPLALACPAGWMLGEVLRFELPEPLSFGWWRLGVVAHDWDLVNGSARVWGTWGLSWCLAALGGWIADLARGRRSLPVHLLGWGPMILAIGLAAVVPAPVSSPGPRVLLVTPGLEQRLKAFSEDRLRTHFVEPFDLAVAALDRLEEEGEPMPDLVVLGETLLPSRLVAAEALAAAAEGAGRPDWAGAPWSESDLREAQRFTDALVGGILYGRPARVPMALGHALSARQATFVDDVEAGRAVLPGGVSLLSGIEEVVLDGTDLRRRNAGALWGPGGELIGTAAKTCLVPAAEDPSGFVELPFLLDALRAVGGYIPDFLPGEEVGVLALPLREGGQVSTSVVICYDNVFDAPFREAALHPDLGFHTVLSNEAWYVDSVEMDHMVAFSRLAALATGRSIVRATNSGATVAFGPAGELVGELRVQGARKMVSGALVVDVPIVAANQAPTPWVRHGGWQPWAWVLLALLLWRAAGRPGSPRAVAGAPGPEGAEEAGLQRTGR